MHNVRAQSQSRSTTERPALNGDTIQPNGIIAVVRFRSNCWLMMMAMLKAMVLWYWCWANDMNDDDVDTVAGIVAGFYIILPVP